jgi:hypothetical protein
MGTTLGGLEALLLAKGGGKSAGLMRIGVGDRAVVFTKLLGCPCAFIIWFDLFLLARGDRAVA